MNRFQFENFCNVASKQTALFIIFAIMLSIQAKTILEDIFAMMFCWHLLQTMTP